MHILHAHDCCFKHCSQNHCSAHGAPAIAPASRYDFMHSSSTLTESGCCSAKPARVLRALAQHCPVLLRQLRPTATAVWQEGVYHSQPGSQAKTSRQQHNNSIQGAAPLLLQGAAADAGWSCKPVSPQVVHSPHLCQVPCCAHCFATMMHHL